MYDLIETVILIILALYPIKKNKKIALYSLWLSLLLVICPPLLYLYFVIVDIELDNWLNLENIDYGLQKLVPIVEQMGESTYCT